MTAQPVDAPQPHLQIDGEDAVIIPMRRLRKLEALEQQASPEALAAAELAAEIAEDEPHLAAYREWEAAGSPGAMSHEEAMAHLLVDGH